MNKVGLKVTAAVTALASVGLGAQAAGASSADQGVREYSLSSSGVISGPSSLRPGLIKFHFSGASGHSFQMATPRNGLGRKTLARDANTLNTTGDPRPLEHDFRLVGGADVGHALFVTLKPGTYYAADTTTQKTDAAKIRVIKVSGATSHASGFPQHAPTVFAVHDTTWTNEPTRIPASGYLRLANEATMPHFAVLAHIRKGKTITDVRKALAGKENPNTVFYSGPKDNYGNGVVSPSRAETTSYALNPGTYALMCFWPDDDPPHQPHANMGMVRTIHLVR